MREDVNYRSLAARFGLSSLGCVVVAAALIVAAIGIVVLLFFLLASSMRAGRID